MKRIIPIIILLTVVGGAYWWFIKPTLAARQLAAESTALIGSGTIEAETIAITAELGGRVSEIMVDEGDAVEAGQVLVELDKADLLAQQLQLQAALLTAQTNLDLISAAARLEDIAVAEAQLAQVEVAAMGVSRTWARINTLVNDPHELEAEINLSLARVAEAERNLEMAQVNLKRMEIQAEAASRNQSNHEALVQHEAAQLQLQATQIGLEMAEVALAGSQRQVEHLVGIHEKPLQLIAQAKAAEAAYHQAEAAILVAQANLAAVKADPTAEDIAVAQAQVQEAEAALRAVEVRLAMQTLLAPREGLISQKLINIGELAIPGTRLLELSVIDTVDLTVYIPETRIGEVKLGHKARVYVDAYDGESFAGIVTFMAHQAEFTPRNVQTQEQRTNLVFAVKITLNNADHRLKPGMPADAEILPELQADRPAVTAIPSARPQPAATPTNTPLPATTPVMLAEQSPTPEPIPTKAELAVSVEVITWRLNVRSGPGVNFSTIALLAQGDMVSVQAVDPTTGWLQVLLPDGQTQGWITDSPTYVSFE